MVIANHIKLKVLVVLILFGVIQSVQSQEILFPFKRVTPVFGKSGFASIKTEKNNEEFEGGFSYIKDSLSRNSLGVQLNSKFNRTLTTSEFNYHGLLTFTRKLSKQKRSYFSMFMRNEYFSLKNESIHLIDSQAISLGYQLDHYSNDFYLIIRGVVYKNNQWIQGYNSRVNKYVPYSLKLGKALINDGRKQYTGEIEFPNLRKRDLNVYYNNYLVFNESIFIELGLRTMLATNWRYFGVHKIGVGYKVNKWSVLWSYGLGTEIYEIEREDAFHNIGIRYCFE